METSHLDCTRWKPPLFYIPARGILIFSRKQKLVLPAIGTAERDKTERGRERIGRRGRELGASTAFHPLEVRPRKSLERVYDIPPTVWFVSGEKKERNDTCQRQTRSRRSRKWFVKNGFRELSMIDRSVAPRWFLVTFYNLYNKCKICWLDSTLIPVEKLNEYR